MRSRPSVNRFVQETRPDLPEINLWRAVLTLAIEHIHSRGTHPNDTRDNARRDARKWFDSRSTSVGRFIWVSDMLRLDPSAVRKAVVRAEGDFPAGRTNSNSYLSQRTAKRRSHRIEYC